MTTKKISLRILAPTGMALASLLMLAAPAFALADTLTRQLEVGSRGADVGTLQTFLAQDSTVYPQGLVTNYFGFLTKSAVSNFQSKNGIDNVGRVGPVTLLAINDQMGTPSTAMVDAINFGVEQPILSNETVTSASTSATFTWNSNMLAYATVRYGTTYPFAYKTAPTVTDQNNYSNAQSVTITGLQPHTAYYYMLESRDKSSNFSWTVTKPFSTQ